MNDFRTDSEHGWIGRSGPGPDFFDLYVMRLEGDESDDPPASALAKLTEAASQIDLLKAQAVAAICAARQARLNWRAGPPLVEWAMVEARIDTAGDLWLSLHEYETDEYSLWMVRAQGPTETWPVRRRPYIPWNGSPGDAGVPV